MSYMTTHTLNWEGDQPSVSEVAERLALSMDASVSEAMSTAFYGEPARWYEATQHLTKLSQEYPGTVFRLECVGEDDDRWTQFFQDGMSYTKRPVMPAFDPGKLRPVPTE